MTMSVRINPAIIMMLIAIISGLGSLSYWSFNFFQGLTSKEEVIVMLEKQTKNRNIVFVELRISDAQGWLRHYNSLDKMNEEQQRNYDSTQTTLHRLYASRDRIMGIAQ